LESPSLLRSREKRKRERTIGSLCAEKGKRTRHPAISPKKRKDCGHPLLRLGRGEEASNFFSVLEKGEIQNISLEGGEKKKGERGGGGFTNVAPGGKRKTSPFLVSLPSNGEKAGRENVAPGK